ncbi:MAG: F0F1 ATP synthase subunit B, partial [Syntrophothermus sp.]
PGLGLIIWMTIAFGGILFILAKYAWKPILKALKERENSIHHALMSAEEAKNEMKKLQFSNEKLLQEAKNERDIILMEARKMKDQIVEEAKTKAGEEANRIVNSAKESIEYEKMAALTELKNQIADISLDIAKKLLQRELSDPAKQQEYIKELTENIDLN